MEVIPLSTVHVTFYLGFETRFFPLAPPAKVNPCKTLFELKRKSSAKISGKYLIKFEEKFLLNTHLLTLYRVSICCFEIIQSCQFEFKEKLFLVSTLLFHVMKILRFLC